MARSKKLYMKDIKMAQSAINRILEAPEDELTINEIRAAASQATELMTSLHKLAGAMDARDERNEG